MMRRAMEDPALEPPAASRGAAIAVRVFQGIALFLILRQWAGARGLWYDEAKLANAILDLPHARIYGPDARHTATPPGFLALTDLVSLAFGESVRALRLPALLAGIATVLLLPVTARRLLSPWGTAFAAAGLAGTIRLQYYFNEVKPYGSDAAIALALLLGGLRLLSAATPTRTVVAIAVAGAIVVWLSNPAIFVLAGVGATLVARAFPGGERALAARAVGASAAWIASFAAYFVARVGGARESEYLQEYWDAFLAPNPFASMAALEWYPARLDAFATDAVGVVPPWIGAVGLVVGAVFLVRRTPWGGAMVLLPALFAVVASLANSYPLEGRLLVFGAPLGLLLLGAVVDGPGAAGARAAWAWRGVAAAVLLLPQVERIVTTAVRVHRREEVGLMVEVLAQRAQPGDVVFVYDGALPMFDYHRRVESLPDLRIVRGARFREEPDRHGPALDRLPEEEPVWALFGHAHRGPRGDEEKLIAGHLSRRRPVLFGYRAPGAALYRFGPAR